MVWISAYMCLACLVLFLTDGNRKTALVRFPIASLQQELSLLSGIGAVATGVWFGKKIKHTHDSSSLSGHLTTRASDTLPPGTLNSILKQAGLQ